MNVKQACGQLRPIDWQFRKFLIDRYCADEVTALTGAIASALVEQGHSCLYIEDHAEECWRDGDGEMHCLPPVDELLAAFRASGAVGKPGDKRPLVLDGGRLYIYKYFNFEKRVAERLRAMTSDGSAKVSPAVLTLARTLMNEQLDLSSSGGQLQAAGVFLPFFSRLSIITGGPGTGKTTVLATMLALLCADAIERGEQLPTIKLAAPTGKAAQRLSVAVQKFLETLDGEGSQSKAKLDKKIVDHLSALVPSTLHRLLGLRGDSPHPKFSAESPIDAGVVVVDEASMMDITTFARLVDALPQNARLILLGDRYQLASVDAGCVMADVCSAFSPNTFPAKFAATVNKAIALPKNHIVASPDGTSLSPVVELKHSYRFGMDKPIGVVSRAVNAGLEDEALAALSVKQSGDDFCTLTPHPGDEQMSKLVLEHFRPLLECTDPGEAIMHLEDFMVLTALNEGRFGREGINQRVFRLYGSIPLVRPIKITQNSPQHGLYNGDMGVIMRSTNDDGSVIERAWFEGRSKNAKGGSKHAKKEDNVRAFLVGALPAHVDAFAITIHNSQGSEFDKVAIVLPEHDVELLTRELLYTAITRARHKAMIFGSEEIVRGAVRRRIERHSGLGGRLG
jgi:exodeoxyribonuclease V alpha subunit